MKKSLDALMRGIRSMKRCALRSASSFGRDPLALGDLRDRLAVLVRAREEEHVLAALAVVPGEDVGPDRRVGVPEMRRRVHVVDGRRHVEGHAGRGRLALRKIAARWPSSRCTPCARSTSATGSCGSTAPCFELFRRGVHDGGDPAPPQAPRGRGEAARRRAPAHRRPGGRRAGDRAEARRPGRAARRGDGVLRRVAAAARDALFEPGLIHGRAAGAAVRRRDRGACPAAGDERAGAGGGEGREGEAGPGEGWGERGGRGVRDRGRRGLVEGRHRGERDRGRRGLRQRRH